MSTTQATQLNPGDCITYSDGYNAGRKRSMKISSITLDGELVYIHGNITTNANPTTATERTTTHMLSKNDTVIKRN